MNIKKQQERKGISTSFCFLLIALLLNLPCLGQKISIKDISSEFLMGSSIEDSSLDVFTRPDSIQFSLSYNHIYNTSKGKTDYFIVNQDSLFINVGLIYDKGLMFVYQGIYNSDTVRNSNVNFVLFKSQLEGCNSGLCEFNYYYLIELDDEQKVSNSIEYLSKDDNIKDIVVIMDNIIFTKGICNWDK